MQIPTLPTDSLHKFQALAGLWLSVLAISLPSYAIFVVKGEIINAERDAEILSVDWDSAKARLAAELKAVGTMSDATSVLAAGVDRLQTARLPREQKLAALDEMERRLTALRDTVSEANTRNDRLGESFDQLRREIVKSRAIVARLRLYVDSIGAVSVYGVVGFVAGMYLTLTGFRGWRHVQRLADDELRLRIPAPSPVVSVTPPVKSEPGETALQRAPNASE